MAEPSLKTSPGQPNEPILTKLEVRQMNILSDVMDLEKNSEGLLKNPELQRQHLLKLSTPNGSSLSSRRCQICRKITTKTDSRSCNRCEKRFHLDCAGLQPPDPSKPIKKYYVCQICQAQRHTKKETLKAEKLKTKEISKTLESFWHADKRKCDKLKKIDKAEEDRSHLLRFALAHPYYVMNSRINFPIDDKLLLAYPQIFDVERPKPMPTAHPYLKDRPEMIADLLLIQNFFITFQEQIGFTHQITKPLLLKSFSIQNEQPDLIFQTLLNFIMNTYLKDVFEKNKTENVRTLNQHAFFTLMSHLNDPKYFENLNLNSLLIDIWPEIIRNLMGVPSMSLAFQDLDLNLRPSDLKLKIHILKKLIQGLSEVDSFHDLIAKKSERLQDMTRERTDLGNQIKKDEAEILAFNQKLKTLESEEKNYGQGEAGSANYHNNKQLREIQKQKKKVQTQKDQSTDRVLSSKSRIQDINKTISFVTTSMIFLGRDRDESEYFLFSKQQDLLYVNFKKSLLSCEEESQGFQVYRTKKVIMDLVKWLNPKGISERALQQTIQGLLKDGVINDYETQNVDYLLIQPPKELLVNQPHRVDKASIKQMILDTEKNFTDYLEGRRCRWAHPQIRETFRRQIEQSDDLQVLRNGLKQLQEQFLFVENVRSKDKLGMAQKRPKGRGRPKTKLGSDSDSISNLCEDRYQQQQFKSGEQSANIQKDSLQCQQNAQQQVLKRTPIRLWGINSQKLRKFWLDYLGTCVDQLGLWICATIFVFYVDKYIRKKKETAQLQAKQKLKERLKEEKLAKNASKQEERAKSHHQEPQSETEHRPALRRLVRKRETKYQESDDSSDGRRKPRGNSSKAQPEPAEDQEIDSSQKSEEQDFVPRRKKLARKARYSSSEEEEPAEQPESKNSHEDACQICKQFGEMLCCDSCPRVFHLECLKLKQLPEGDWYCVHCLQKMAMARQTRSRARQAL